MAGMVVTLGAHKHRCLVDLHPIPCPTSLVMLVFLFSIGEEILPQLCLRRWGEIAAKGEVSVASCWFAHPRLLQPGVCVFVPQFSNQKAPYEVSVGSQRTLHMLMILQSNRKKQCWFLSNHNKTNLWLKWLYLIFLRYGEAFEVILAHIWIPILRNQPFRCTGQAKL